MLSTLIMSAPVGVLSPGHYGALLWGSIGLVMVLLLGLALMWFRGKYHPGGMLDENRTSSFSMRSLEEMRAGGMISDDEFRRLRAGALGLEPQAVDDDNSTLSMPGVVDDGTEEPDPGNKPQNHKEIK